MNVNTSAEDREKAPHWSTTWGRLWGKRDKQQFETMVVRCERCAKARAKNPDRGFWQYAYPGSEGNALVLTCRHFIKEGAPLPQEA